MFLVVHDLANMSQFFFTIFGTYWYPSLYVAVRKIFSELSFSFFDFVRRSFLFCSFTLFFAFVSISWGYPFSMKSLLLSRVCFL